MKESYDLLTGQSCSQIDFKYTFLIFIVLVGKKKVCWPTLATLLQPRPLQDFERCHDFATEWSQNAVALPA
jgi:hypothetical protein